MNYTLKQILLKRDRNEDELSILAEYLKTFKHFQHLDKLSSYQQLLVDIQGVLYTSNTFVYNFLDRNDQQVYFILYGEASKLYYDNRTIFMALNTTVRAGDFFGCYDDLQRAESVKVTQETLILRMHRKYYTQLNYYTKYMVNIRSKVMKQLFPQLSQIQFSSQYLSLINLAQYTELSRGDDIINPAGPLGGERNSKLDITNGFLYILIEGTCDISVDLEVPQQEHALTVFSDCKKTLTHKISAGEPITVIGDEQIFTQSQWDSMTAGLPLKFPTKYQADDLTYSHFYAQVTSEKAKFLVLPIVDLINQFPSNIFRPFKEQCSKKLQGYLKSIKHFCWKKLPKPKPILEEDNKPTSPRNVILKKSATLRLPTEESQTSKTAVNRTMNIMVKKSYNNFKSTKAFRSPISLLKINKSQDIDKESIFQKILTEGSEYMLMETTRRQIKSRLQSGRCRTEESQTREQTAQSPRFVLMGRKLKMKKMMETFEVLNL